MNFLNVIFILFAHFIGDFICQSREKAIKQCDDEMLAAQNSAVYSLIMTVCIFVITGPEVALSTELDAGLYFIGLVLLFTAVGVSHALTNWFTCRSMRRSYRNKELDHFWNVFGFDQFLHILIIFTFYDGLFILDV